MSPTSVAQGGSSQVYIFPSHTTPAGTYPIVFKGTSADGKTGSATFTLTVTGFGFSTGGNAPRAW
ncbi:hypothetical protein ACFQV2_14505 [Actinokineospora soli]|uniref:Uncharacterized protein n=1 Tax=Actinokineospora soli TaxID=1048753 RepID=A0ABW2TLC4_9PSEU